MQALMKRPLHSSHTMSTSMDAGFRGVLISFHVVFLSGYSFPQLTKIVNRYSWIQTLSISLADSRLD